MRELVVVGRDYVQQDKRSRTDVAMLCVGAKYCGRNPKQLRCLVCKKSTLMLVELMRISVLDVARFLKILYVCTSTLKLKCIIIYILR